MAARDFDEIADDLYALRPGEFVAARDEQVREARAAGDRALAQALTKLRRPTMSAWLINTIRRDQASVVEELLSLAADLRRAHRQGSGPALADLSAQRRTLLAGLIRQARKLGSDAGVEVTADMAREMEETFAAALVRPDVAAEVRAGRVVRPSAPEGFGTLLSAVPSLADEHVPAEPASGRPVRVAPAASRARERAERRAEQARRAVETKAAELDTCEKAVGAATRRYEELGDQVDQARERLRDLEQRALAEERGVRAETRRRERALRAYAEARHELDDAEQQLRE